VEVNAPGEIARLVAPVVDQLRVELAPEVMLAGLAVKELITGLPVVAFTVTVAVAVVEPALSVAVRVYVVVAVGLTLVEPVANVEVNVPGAMAMLVAPVVDQFRVALAPALTAVGFAANEAIVGTVPFVVDELEAPPQPVSPARADRTQAYKTGRAPLKRKVSPLGMVDIPRSDEVRQPSTLFGARSQL
jgi:hypothetical protein